MWARSDSFDPGADRIVHRCTTPDVHRPPQLQVEHIQEDLSDRYCFRAETFIERDWVALMKTSSAKFDVADPLQPPEKSSKKSKSKGRPPQVRVQNHAWA